MSQTLCRMLELQETKLTWHSSVPRWTYSKTWILRHKAKYVHAPDFINQCPNCGGSAKNSHGCHRDTRLPIQHQRQSTPVPVWVTPSTGSVLMAGLRCCEELVGLRRRRLELCPDGDNGIPLSFCSSWPVHHVHSSRIHVPSQAQSKRARP